MQREGKGGRERGRMGKEGDGRGGGRDEGRSGGRGFQTAKMFKTGNMFT